MKSRSPHTPEPSPEGPDSRSRRRFWRGVLLLAVVAFVPTFLAQRWLAERQDATGVTTPVQSETIQPMPARVETRTDEMAAAIALEDRILAARPTRILVKPKDGAALDDIHATTGTRVNRSFDSLGGLQIVDLPAGLSAADAIASFQRSGLIEYAEEDRKVHVLATPNDFRYSDGSLWNLNNTAVYGGVVGADIKAAAAWDYRTDASSVIVAVVDTGARTTHEDLAANLWVNVGETGTDSTGADKRTNRIDDDNNGFIDDVHGINTIDTSGGPYDLHGHGTHLVGTIAAVGNNNVGVTGIAWKSKVMVLKFESHDGDGSISDAIICIDYARTHGARVVNASWGDYGFESAALRDAISRLNDAGILFVAAAGNDDINNDDNPLYPASYDLPNVISVGATDRSDHKTAFSNYGRTSVDIAAPGDPVFSTWSGSDNDYRYCVGTSMAAPHVTGAVALLRAEYPNETAAQIKARILSTADPLPTFADRTVTGGRLNLLAAISQNSSSQNSALTALSVRSLAGSGDNTLIAGLVVSGTVPKNVIFRGVGSTLPALGVQGALADTAMTIYSGSNVVASNDNWGGGSSMTQAFASVGLAPIAADSRDAAIVPPLNSGVYTAHVGSMNGTTGVALLEIYDSNPSNHDARLSAISVRSYSGPGADVLIVGVVVSGTAPRRVVIRGVGPSMGADVPSRIMDPEVRVYNGPTVIHSNDNWGGGAGLSAAFSSVGLPSFDPASKDAAIIANLEPGVYTVQLTGVGNTSGVGLLEVYELP